MPPQGHYALWPREGFATRLATNNVRSLMPDHNESPAPQTQDNLSVRRVRPALFRGWRRRCPRCGKGALLHGYLRVRDTCPVCRQELHHHRADDGPAYLTILIVGHVMAPLLHFAFVTWRPEPLILFATFAVGCVALSLYLLPRLKGAIVGYQWARGMGGFA